MPEGGQWLVGALGRVPLRTPEPGLGRVKPTADGCGWLNAPPAAAAAGEELVTALVGRVRWEDPELQQVSGEQGAAQALLRGYRRYGRDVVQRLSGGFALAVLDAARGEALIAVDRLGQHGLAFTEHRGELHFATDIRWLPGAAGSADSLEPSALYAYLYFHMVPAPWSVHRGVSKLPAAHRLVWSGGERRQDRYWSPAFREDADSAPSPGAVLETLRGAVERAAEGDSPTGAFLSGGLDSSTVAGLLGQRHGRADSFSIGFDAAGYDEIEYARIAARHFGLNAHEHYVTPQDVADAVVSIARACDEPFGNSSIVPTFCCARLARQHGIGRLLAGDGGDELFAGNERYRKQQVFEVYQRLPQALRRNLLGPVLGRLPQGLPGVSKLGSYVRQAGIPLPDRLQSYNYLHRHSPGEVFQPEFLEQVDTDAPLGLLRDIYNAPEAATPLKRMLYLDWQQTLADNDLRKVRTGCSLAGVEVAFPMLDEAVVDLAAAVPSAMLLPGRRLRGYYKDAMEGFLPREILDKPKHGFGLPFGVWLRDDPALRDMAADCLASVAGRGIFRPAFVEETQRMHQEVHAGYYGELVWLLMALELWMREGARSCPRQEAG